jgi:hypothetical protein
MARSTPPDWVYMLLCQDPDWVRTESACTRPLADTSAPPEDHLGGAAVEASEEEGASGVAAAIGS